MSLCVRLDGQHIGGLLCQPSGGLRSQPLWHMRSSCGPRPNFFQSEHCTFWATWLDSCQGILQRRQSLSGEDLVEHRWTYLLLRRRIDPLPAVVHPHKTSSPGAECHYTDMADCSASGSLGDSLSRRDSATVSSPVLADTDLFFWSCYTAPPLEDSHQQGSVVPGRGCNFFSHPSGSMEIVGLASEGAQFMSCTQLQGSIHKKAVLPQVGACLILTQTPPSRPISCRIASVLEFLHDSLLGCLHPL